MVSYFVSGFFSEYPHDPALKRINVHLSGVTPLYKTAHIILEPLLVIHFLNGAVQKAVICD